ncbi:MAG TPA: SGNH/GDSL hydrolase family protein, partial [Planctomycetota bacterium]|nr:SGNH/GDSL hydrolase family protein [Planctomycetota bacterium]
ARCRKLPNCQPILQTYYSADIAGLEADARPGNQEGAMAKSFPVVMQAVREVAAETNCLFIDHLKRWEPLRKADLKGYRALMHDRLHMSVLGHTVFGLDVLRQFGVTPIKQWVGICAEAVAVQKRLDALAG